MPPPPTCVAIIPARGGSKGIPRKNARPFAGVPLIARAVQGALASRRVTRVIVSTDDEEMLRLAVDAGAEAPFGLRPPELATDTARTVDVIKHVLQFLKEEEGKGECDFFVMLQPTSPLRRGEDIDGAVGMLVEASAGAAEGEVGIEAVVTVCEASHHPMKMHRMREDGLLEPFVENTFGTVNRKELPTAYQENGACYVQAVKSFWGNENHFYCGLRSKKVGAYVMDAERSVDLDTDLDWKMAEMLMDVLDREEALEHETQQAKQKLEDSV